MSDEPALPWFPFYAADFTNSKKVRLMTPEEVGVYTLLLAHQWQTGPIDLPPDRLGMFTQGADPNAVAAVLERCFIETDEGWVNERLEEVRQEQVEKRQQKVRAGKASAKARRRKRLEKATALEQRSSSVATERQQKANNTESESDTETDGEKRPPQKRSRATALPDDWAPNDSHQELATDEGVHLGREAEKFRNHAAATGRTQKDWDASFRNWLMKAAEFATNSPDGKAQHHDRYIPGVHP